jgi:autotransporter-associated beta strand protein
MLIKIQPNRIVKKLNQLSLRPFLSACTLASALLAMPVVHAGTVTLTFGFQQGNLTTNTVAYGSGATYSGVLDGRITDNSGTSALSTSATATLGNQFQSGSPNGQQHVGLFAYDLTELNNFITANSSATTNVAITSVSFTLVSAGANSGTSTSIRLFGTDPFTSSATWSNSATATPWTAPYQNIGSTVIYGYAGGGSQLTGSLGGTSPNTAVTSGNAMLWTSSAGFITAVTNALARADKKLYLTANVAISAFTSGADNRLSVNFSPTTTVASRPLLQITVAVTTTPTWTGGGGNTSWTTAGNWLSNTVPTTGDAIIFNAASSANLNTVLNQNFSVSGLSVTNPSGPVSIGGANTLTNGAGGIDLSAATQNLTITAPMVLGAAQSWTVTNGRTLSVNGGVSGGVALTVAGTGAVSIGGVASYTGATTVNSGVTLKMGAANVLPSGAGVGNLILNGTLDLNGSSQAINGLSGSGVLDNVGGGGASVITVGTITNNAASSFSGSIQNTSGTLALVYIGTNSLTLNGTNNFSGGFTNNGAAMISTGSAAGTNYCFGTGPVVLNAGVFYPSVQSYTFTNALTLNGATLEIGGASSHLLTWSGPVRITADSFLSCDGGTAGITLSGAVTNTGSTLTCVGSGTASTISGVISGTGTIMPNFASSTLNLNAANTFSGTNRAAIGTLKIGNVNALQSATLDMNAADSGTVNLNNLSATIGALTGPRSLALGSGAISIGNNNASTLYSGALSGSGSLRKIGAGTLTLGGTNTYSGTSTISTGTLALGANGGITNSASIIVAGGATFDVSAQTTPFTLAQTLSSQILSNSTVSAVINGNNNCSAGTISLIYDGINASFIQTNGAMTLSAATVLKVKNTGATLSPGAYKIIAKATAGNVGSIAGTAPSSVSVVGGPSAGTPSLAIVNGELYLIVGGTSNIGYTGTGPFTYDGTAHSPVANFSGSTGARTSEFVGTSVSYGPSVNAPTNAGIYYLSNTVATDANYFGATNAQAFTISPASTSVGVSSTANPSGYQDAVAFLAALPVDATGSVIFASTNGSISTNAVSAGSATSSSVNNLPRGTNLISVVYLGDSNYLGSTNGLNQVVTNHPPVANNAGYTRNAGIYQLNITISQLLTNVTDVDNDAISLISVGTSTNGITLATNATLISYYNTNGVSDEFTYTVSDGFGGTTTGTVRLGVNNTSPFGQSSPSISTVGGAPTISFAGIPGYSYSVARSTNVNFIPFDIIWTTNAPSGGLFDYTDHSAPTPAAFYRLQYNP